VNPIQAIFSRGALEKRSCVTAPILILSWGRHPAWVWVFHSCPSLLGFNSLCCIFSICFFFLFYFFDLILPNKAWHKSFCKCSVFNFSWELQSSLKKLKTRHRQNCVGKAKCIMGNMKVADSYSAKAMALEVPDHHYWCCLSRTHFVPIILSSLSFSLEWLEPHKGFFPCSLPWWTPKFCLACGMLARP